jgi:hypothetical protein
LLEAERALLGYRGVTMADVDPAVEAALNSLLKEVSKGVLAASDAMGGLGIDDAFRVAIEEVHDYASGAHVFDPRTGKRDVPPHHVIMIVERCLWELGKDRDLTRQQVEAGISDARKWLARGNLIGGL